MTGQEPAGPPSGEARARPPTTIRLALLTFAVGFLVEAGAEIYQFASYGLDRPGWIGLYYLGLGTTGAGFYLMYRGRKDWTELHRRNLRHGHRLAWAAAAIFAGAVAVIAGLGASGAAGSSAAGAGSVLAWLAGGLVTLAFGNFFLGLALVVDGLAGPTGRTLAWAGFAWSLGVAVLTGAIVGGELPTLVHRFFTDPHGLVVSFAPLAFVIAPLFVTYLLLAAAYLDAGRRLRRGYRRAPS